jgi:hypothetical protein
MSSNQLNENEYSPFYKNYILALKNVNLTEVLTSSLDEFLAIVKNLREEKLQYSYAEGKWTIKEIIQHLIDTERIMSYRALRFSRNDTNERNIHDLLDELTLVRKTSVSLFKSFTDEMLIRIGTANGGDMTVRALGFIIAGHQLHHLNIIRERYL